MQLNALFRSLLAAYACGASGNYASAIQEYSDYRRGVSPTVA
ncbi:hypothetical protein N5D61_09795 [Pseudomonas sp. GD03842]|nr:hypothetical protein [Pseudomonas sp. GD03842]MDH0746635.1 hypothetical protein [Pseudomonas sp. GD03842]